MFDCPSKVKQGYWIVERDRDSYFSSTFDSGKWCAWFSPEDIDEAWQKVLILVKEGVFVCAKVSTALAPINNSHVIIVYNDDYRNIENVNKNRDELKKLGFKNLKYKRDVDTMNDMQQFIYECE